MKETVRQPVQWLLIAQDPTHHGRVAIALLDANQLVGSCDLEIGESTLGPLILRPPYGGWVDREVLKLELRVGQLSPDNLSRAHTHWFGNARNATAAAEEVDADPEYQEWLETIVEPAHRSLFSTRPGARRRWLLTAAAILLSLLVGSLVRQNMGFQESLEDQEATVRELRAQTLELEQSNHSLDLANRESQNTVHLLSSRLEEAEEQNHKTLQSLVEQQRIAERLRLENSLQLKSPRGLSNAVVEALRPTKSSVSKTLQTTGDAVLMLTPDEDQRRLPRRARLFRQSTTTDELLWTSDVLSPNEYGYFLVVIPSDFLSPGDYHIQLQSLEGEPSADFYLDIE